MRDQLFEELSEAQKRIEAINFESLTSPDIVNVMSAFRKINVTIEEKVKEARVEWQRRYDI